jgi:hypothetical protein
MSTQLERRALRLAAIGMDERQCNTLRLMCLGPCRNACVLVSEVEAEAFVVDMDSYQAVNRLGELRKTRPEQPALLLSLRSLSDELAAGDLYVSKPVRIEAFNQALTELRRISQPAPPPPQPERLDAPRMPAAIQSLTATENGAISVNGANRAARLMDGGIDHAYVGSAPDIDPNLPEQLEKAYYDPERYLQGIVMRARDLARAQRCGVLIRGAWPALTISADATLVQVLETDSRLRPYCAQPDVALGASLDCIDAPPMEFGQPGVISLDAFLWKLALFAARGRLPRNTPLDAPIMLRHWPNFTRLTLTPGALNIAALWAAGPLSPLHTAQHLGLPQRHVFAFYSAAHALDLAFSMQRAADRRIELPVPPATPQQGLLRRILGKLRFGRAQIEQ